MKNTCTISGCNGEHLARGYCNLHYHRWKKYGDPLKAFRPYKREDEVRVDVTGYLRKKGGKHVHREVAEYKLGRQLLPNEIVHHIDGNKLNNHPDNLEVLSSRAEHVKHHRHQMNRTYK